MKKTYVTPSICIEHYELTQSIAACDLKIGLMDSACVLSSPNATKDMKNYAMSNWFLSNTACAVYAEGMQDSTGICYHTNANAAFTS